MLQYRRTPLDSGYSPSELLNGRQIRSKLDARFPSPAQAAQGKQAKEATRSQQGKDRPLVAKTYQYSVGTPCYALYCGPRHNKQPRWVPAIIIKVLRFCTVNICVNSTGPTWRRHVDQLRPRYGIENDTDPGETPTVSTQSPEPAPPVTVQPYMDTGHRSPPAKQHHRQESPDIRGPTYGPRRSERLWRKKTVFNK